jgi:ribonuclease J
MDHSSPEAFAFLIEAAGKRIFYSGDFRATGNKGVLFENLLKLPPKDIDILFIEGTMAERTNAEYPDEEAVKNAIVDIVKGQKNVSFVVSSAQNIDRFVSLIKACIIAKKQVVIDVYNAWVLEIVKKKSPGLPTIDWDQVLVYNHPGQMEKIAGAGLADFHRRVELKSVGNKIFSNPSGFVYFLRCPSLKLIDALRKHGPINLIYSQWEGYLRPEHHAWFADTITALRADKGICFSSIHTSGHAVLEDLKKLGHALSPNKIVPIHTELPDKLKVEFEKDGFANVDVWEDGKPYQI